MAEKNWVPLPYNIKAEDGGLSLRIEFDAHYLSDDEAAAIRRYIEELRELLRELWASCPIYEVDCAECRHAKADNSGEWVRYDCGLYERMQELGVEV